MTLSKLLSELNPKLMEENVASGYFRPLAEAVAYLHREKISHRDLKLSNVLIDKTQKIKLIDFGFAENTGGMLREFCGTLSYMAPELIEKKEYLGAKADIWSLGVILFRLVSGKFPFGSTLYFTLDDEDKDVRTRITEGKATYPSFMSPECRDLLDGCFKTDPERRWSIDQVLGSEWLSIMNLL